MPFGSSDRMPSRRTSEKTRIMRNFPYQSRRQCSVNACGSSSAEDCREKEKQLEAGDNGEADEAATAEATRFLFEKKKQIGS
jgi:hypothetical protein